MDSVNGMAVRNHNPDPGYQNLNSMKALKVQIEPSMQQFIINV